MNFLGHLYFSNNDFDLMIANLFGDSVKGKKYLNYSLEIQRGILLHRKIDFYIDTHPAVKELKLELYHDLPKVAGIAIDLFFDHLLAIHWNKFHDIPLNSFLATFYVFRSSFESEMSPEFLYLLKQIRENKWLSYYSSTYGLEKSCQGVSRRISFENNLDKAPGVFINKEKEIRDVFFVFMKDAVMELSNQVDMS